MPSFAFRFRTRAHSSSAPAPPAESSVKEFHSSPHPPFQSRPLPTLKDNDFMHDVCKLYLEEQDKQRVLEHLTRDIAVSVYVCV